MESIRKKAAELPDAPGVYLFKNSQQEVLYIGKAASLRKRVRQYLVGRTHSVKIDAMLAHAADLDFIQVPSEADALLLEAALINQHAPRYNTLQKDDKSYPLLKITKEPYPQLLITRKRDKKGLYFGPYTDAGLLREAVKLIHHIFPIRKCRTLPKKACLYYYLNQCIAPCIHDNPEVKVRHDALIAEIAAFLGTGKRSFVSYLTDRMKEEAAKLNFEEAGRIKNKIQALSQLNRKRFSPVKGAGIAYTATEQLKVSLGIKGKLDRIVCFDVSNLMGKWAVASKVSFFQELPDKQDYRRFKIKSVKGINDYEMMREALGRMLRGIQEKKHARPDLFLIDGGPGHLTAAYDVLVREGFGDIPMAAIAKRFEILYMRDKEPILLPPESATLHLVQKIRDEAHRFAVNYHTRLRAKATEKSFLDGISGIGPERKRQILKAFNSPEEIRQASAVEISQRTKISQSLAEYLKEQIP